MNLYTVAELPSFEKTASRVWSTEEREDFVNWIAENPTAGDVIPGSGGLRKVRWTAAGKGKKGGSRVIYYNLLEDGTIWLLIVYVKSKFENLPQKLLLDLKEEIDG